MLAAFVVLSSCHMGKEDVVVNGYQTNGDWQYQWFEVSPEDFVDQLNEKMKEKGYPALELLEDSFSKRYYSNDGKWYLAAESWTDESTPKESKGKLSHIRLNLFAIGKNREEMNPEYVRAIIDLFSPGKADQVIKELHIFDKNWKGPLSTRKTSCGNAVYYYGPSAVDIPEFGVYSVKIEKNEKNDKSPSI